jgi:hypothetical protein
MMTHQARRTAVRVLPVVQCKGMDVIMEEEQYHINTCDNRGRRGLFTSKGRFPRAAGTGEPEPERVDDTLSEDTTALGSA